MENILKTLKPGNRFHNVRLISETKTSWNWITKQINTKTHISDLIKDKKKLQYKKQENQAKY